MPITVPGLSTAVSPAPFTSAFPLVNTFILSGAPMPGKWTLVSAPKVFGWQIQQGYGLSGAVVFPKGDELVKPKFRGEFFAQSDFLLFQQLRKRLLNKGTISLGVISVAHGISHPELEALGVTSVVVLTINPLVDEGGGFWTTEIEFLQYRKPSPVPPKPDQSTPAVPNTNVNAVTAQQAELQKLSAQVNSAKAALFGKR